MLFNNLIIKSINGHYEAYLNDKFICSGDTYNECYQDAIELLNNRNEIYN